MFGPNCLIFSIIKISMEHTVVTTTALTKSDFGFAVKTPFYFFYNSVDDCTAIYIHCWPAAFEHTFIHFHF